MGIRRTRNPDTKLWEDAIVTPCGYGPLTTIRFPSTGKTFLENALEGGFEFDDSVKVEEMNQFIVAEVSKNWPRPILPSNNLLISQKFESVIKFNYEHGYKLHSWYLNRMNDSMGNLNETIIAVFEKFE